MKLQLVCLDYLAGLIYASVSQKYFISKYAWECFWYIAGWFSSNALKATHSSNNGNSWFQSLLADCVQDTVSYASPTHLGLCPFFPQVNIPFVPKFLSKIALRYPTTSWLTSACAKTTRGPIGPLAGLPGVRSPSGPTARLLCPQVVQFQFPGLLYMPASLHLLPPGLVLSSFRADITCFWIHYQKTLPWGTLGLGPEPISCPLF